MKLFKLLLFLSSCIAFNSYAASNLDNCLTMAKQMNLQLPRKIDYITTLEATSCLEDKGKVFFQYVHIIQEPSAFTKDVERKSQLRMKSQYCSNSEFRKVLEFFSFDFYYVDNKHNPLFTFTLTKSDC